MVKVSTGVNLVPKVIVLMMMAIRNPGNSGEKLLWSQLNPQSEHQMRSGDTSPVQLTESESQDSVRHV
jgi:hypothetical protein